MVESGSDPGSQTRRHVCPGEEGHGDGGPGQHGGDAGGDEEDGEEVGEDVDGLVVPVGETVDAADDIQGRTVVGVNIFIKPEQEKNI